MDSERGNTKSLLIIFVKNSILGKTKTRIAKAVGHEKAVQIHEKLVQNLESKLLKNNTFQVHIYYSDFTVSNKWKGYKQYIQEGSNIGERMHHAISQSIKNGFQSCVLVGTDIPDLSLDIIQEAFNKLKENDFVFGPAHDGGYYLIGTKYECKTLFEGITWSSKVVLEQTIAKINHAKYTLLPVLHDVDTLEDLLFFKLL